MAELGAEGLTSAQIAQALFVTGTTIQTHLATTYRKLGISSRRGLPAAAVSCTPRGGAGPGDRCRHSLPPSASCDLTRIG
jgi:hypothetical protein